MLLAVLSGFAVGAIAPLLTPRLGRAAGWLLALLPLTLTLWFVQFLPAAIAGSPAVASYAWVPSLGATLSFRIDGLALLFALLITGIGTVIVVYAGGYLGEERAAGRLYGLLLWFMASMLGLVTCNNLLGVYVFWELTSLTSYLLIGYHHESETSRKAALQALLVTAAGGLALLAGSVLLGGIAGTYDIAELASHGPAIRAHALYPAVLACVLAGAFTKSAQFPFHFWLPSAMAAPTPISAYLHSATMVKAGVFLLARLTPVLGGTALWVGTLEAVGATTMVAASFLASQQSDLKRLLAYTTVATLGMLTMLLGAGTAVAVKASMALVLAHALYKGALFMVAGIVDHETGTRDVLSLSGLGKRLPATTIAAGLAAASAAGLMPFFGFISKETVYTALLERPWMLFATVLANAFGMLIAVLVGWQVFYGRRAWTPRPPREAGVALWLGPMLLGLAGLAIGAWAGVSQGLIGAAASATFGRPVPVRLALWHGFEQEAMMTLLLSVVTLALGLVFYSGYHHFLRLGRHLDPLNRLGPMRWYDLALSGMLALAHRQTRWLQNGYLRVYLMTVLLSVLVPVAWVVAARVSLPASPNLAEVRVYEAVIAGLVLAGTSLVLVSKSRLTAVAGLGVVGYGVAFVFLLYGAPDLALTQFAVETLTVILFVLALYRLPRFATLSSRAARARDATIALATGALMTTLVMATTPGPSPSRLSAFFAERSVPDAFGRNVVNVILVDFRGLDTMGEITVVAVAALGVYALLKLRPAAQAE